MPEWCKTLDPTIPITMSTTCPADLHRARHRMQQAVQSSNANRTTNLPLATNESQILNTAHSPASSFSNHVNSILPSTNALVLLNNPLPELPTHQVTFIYIDQQYADLNPPPKLPSQDVRKSQYTRSRSSTVNVHPSSIPVPLNINLSPVESIIPCSQAIPAPVNQSNSTSVEISQTEIETQPVVQVKQSSFSHDQAAPPPLKVTDQNQSV